MNALPSCRLGDGNIALMRAPGKRTTPGDYGLYTASVRVEKMPWVPQLKACMSYGRTKCGDATETATLVVGGPYRLRTPRPVTV